MLFDKRLASGEELPSDVREGAVGSEMTRVGGGIPGIPGSNLFLNDVPNGVSSGEAWGVAATVAPSSTARNNKHFMAGSGHREGRDYSKSLRETDASRNAGIRAVT